MQCNDHEQAVKHTVEWLIINSSRYNLPVLRRLYHEDLEVMRIDEQGSVTVLDRAAILAESASLRDAGAPYPDTSTEFNLLVADAGSGQVIVTRRMRVDGRAEKRIVSLDLVRENGRWRIRQETVVVQVDDGIDAGDSGCGLRRPPVAMDATGAQPR